MPEFVAEINRLTPLARSRDLRRRYPADLATLRDHLMTRKAVPRDVLARLRECTRTTQEVNLNADFGRIGEEFVNTFVLPALRDYSASPLAVTDWKDLADAHLKHDLLLTLADGTMRHADAKATIGASVCFEDRSHGKDGWVLAMPARSLLLVVRLDEGTGRF